MDFCFNLTVKWCFYSRNANKQRTTQTVLASNKLNERLWCEEKNRNQNLPRANSKAIERKLQMNKLQKTK